MVSPFNTKKIGRFISIKKSTRNQSLEQEPKTHQLKSSVPKARPTVCHMLYFTGERDRERTLTDNQPDGNTQQYTTYWLLQSCEDVGAECMMIDG